VGFIFTFSEDDEADSWLELYKTGNIRFVKELILSDDSMPEDVFFEQPIAVISDHDSNIYVLDSQANNIKKFDSAGKFIKIIGREGQGPGELSTPLYMTFAKDKLVVWDLRNRRLCAFTSDGEFITSSAISYDEGSVRKIRSLPNGVIVVEKEKSFRREPDKAQICSIDLYSTDLKYERTIYSRKLWRKKYVRTKDFGISTLYFPFAPDLFWDVIPAGLVVIGYSTQYEIEMYDSSGKKLSSFSNEYNPVKVTANDREEYFAGLVFSRNGVILNEIPEYITKYTEFPKNKPAFRNILADSEGRILVVTHKRDKSEEGKVFDVFNAEGKFQTSARASGDISFPMSRWAAIQDGFFWAIETDEEDLFRVIKYKIVGSGLTF
jgi:hypothetical protein